MTRFGLLVELGSASGLEPDSPDWTMSGSGSPEDLGFRASGLGFTRF